MDVVVGASIDPFSVSSSEGEEEEELLPTVTGTNAVPQTQSSKYIAKTTTVPPLPADVHTTHPQAYPSKNHAKGMNDRQKEEEEDEEEEGTIPPASAVYVSSSSSARRRVEDHDDDDDDDALRLFVTRKSSSSVPTSLPQRVNESVEQKKQRRKQRAEEEAAEEKRKLEEAEDEALGSMNLFVEVPSAGPNEGRFNTKTFVFEFLTHLLYPLSIPFVLMAQGKVAASNKGLIPGQGVFIFQLLFTLLHLGPMIAVLSVMSQSDMWAVPPMLVGVIFGIFRLLVIGGKYGCFTQVEYRQVLTGDYDCVAKLLMTFWNTEIPIEAVDHELDVAERTVGIYLEEMFLIMDDGGHSQLSAKSYTRRLVREVFGRPTLVAFFQWSRLSLAVIVSMYTLWAFLQHAVEYRSARSIALLITIVVQIFAFASIVFGFLGVGVLHYYRMYRMRSCFADRLLFSREVALGRNRKQRTKLIPACVPSNLVAWASISEVLSEYASTYTRRMSFNFSANLVICGILGGVLILQAWMSSSAGSSSVSLPTDVSFSAVVAFIFLVMAVGMLPSTYFAYLANRSDEAVLRKVQDEKFSILWRHCFGSISSVAIMSSIGEPAIRPRTFPSVLPRLFAGAGGAQATPRGGNLEDLHDYNVVEGLEKEFEVAVETIVPLIEKRLNVNPLRVMFVAASPELLSFFASIVVTGAVLVAGVLVQTGQPGTAAVVP